MKRMPYVAVHQSIGLLKGIVHQPSNLNSIKGSAHNLHTNFTGSYEHFPWNRAKNFKVLVWRAADLESYLYMKNTAKYKPFQVRCTAKPKTSKSAARHTENFKAFGTIPSEMFV